MCHVYCVQANLPQCPLVLNQTMRTWALYVMSRLRYRYNLLPLASVHFSSITNPVNILIYALLMKKAPLQPLPKMFQSFILSTQLLTNVFYFQKCFQMPSIAHTVTRKEIEVRERIYISIQPGYGTQKGRQDIIDSLNF